MATCGFYLALWSRLIEIGVRATFSLFALICTRICGELEEQIEEIVGENETTNGECLKEGCGLPIGEFDDNEEMLKNRELQKLKEHFEKIQSLIENFSNSFGLIVFLFSCNDFAIAIFKFTDVLLSDEKVERVLSFAHQCFRIFTFLAASNQVCLKVRKPYLLFNNDQELTEYY